MKPIQFIVCDSVVQIASISLHRYSNNALAVVLETVWDDGPSEPTKLSVNFDHGQDITSGMLQDGQFFAKDYNEMKPIYAAVLKAGLIKELGPRGRSEHVTCPLCELTELGKSMIGTPAPSELCENCCQPKEDENLFVCNKCGEADEKMDTPK